ncbi:DNA helicase Pif1 like [Carpediemonas membranifera]|uniref:ATP-dependent DNA helicase n=1 Tax=Carpediemonas membranifera TaxID=201153 RepID=A0A8J6ARG8_9EUKA|nr:DNA helicase Pif1 like [Carpediemonas membranifera]|eukprot:KAG9392098.1 DNA helicase Pif1 like [Carpediemonas membranifera]
MPDYDIINSTDLGIPIDAGGSDGWSSDELTPSSDLSDISDLIDDDFVPSDDDLAIYRVIDRDYAPPERPRLIRPPSPPPASEIDLFEVSLTPIRPKVLERTICAVCKHIRLPGCKQCPCPADDGGRLTDLQDELSSMLTRSIGAFDAETAQHIKALSHREFRALNHALALATTWTSVQASKGLFVVFKGVTTAFGKTDQYAQTICGDSIATVPQRALDLTREWLTANSATFRAMRSTIQEATNDGIEGQISFSFTNQRDQGNHIAFTPNAAMSNVANADAVATWLDEDNVRRTKYVQFESDIAAFATFPLLFPDGRGFSDQYRARYKHLKTWVRHTINAAQTSFVRTNPATATFLSLAHTSYERITARRYTGIVDEAQTEAANNGVLSVNANGNTHSIAPPTLQLSLGHMHAIEDHLKAMLARYGCPHFFWTFTIDPDSVIQCLHEMAADPSDPLPPPLFERRHTPRHAPVDAAHVCLEYFTTIFEELKSKLTGTTENPGDFPICEFATRIEEQENSMLHIHTVTWHKGIGQKLPTGDIFTERLAKAVDAIVSTDSSVMSPKSTFYQTHRCNEHCKRRGTQCKQGYPAPACNISHINQNGEFLAKRTQSDAFITPFCPLIAENILGSMHVTPVTSAEVIMYLTKYITKPPAEVIEEVSARDTRDIEPHHLIFQQRRRIIGPPMLAILLEGTSIFSASTPHEKIDTDVLPEKRIYGPRNRCTTNKVGEWTKYYNRPVELEHLTYVQFRTFYDTRSKKASEISKFKDEEQIRYSGADGTKYFWRIWKRRRPVTACIPMTIPSDGDRHYFNLLALHKPWRSDEEMRSIGTTRCSYSEKCFDLGLIDDDELDDDQAFDIAWHLHFNTNLDNHGYMAIVRAALEKNGAETTMQMINAVQDVSRKYMLMKHVLNNTKQAYVTNHDVIARWEAPRKLDTSINLDSNQATILNHYVSKLRSKTQTILLLMGRAGTGKSVVLRHIAKHTSDQGLLVLVTAATGAAAVNIDGTTIHSLFQWTEGRFTAPVKGTVPWILLNNATTITIDEAFTLSAADIQDLNDALCIARRNQDPFGGVNLILVGDPYQLPPVNSRSFSSYKSAYHFGWSNYKYSAVILSNVHRQASDPAFTYALNGLQRGDMSAKHVTLFAGRATIDRFDALIHAALDGATIICGTRSRQAFLNDQCVQALAHYGGRDMRVYKNVVLLPLSIEDRPIDVIPGTPEQFTYDAATELAVTEHIYDFETRLVDTKLCIGARVMLTSNDYYDKGVANGSIGTVTAMGARSVTVVFNPESESRRRALIIRDRTVPVGPAIHKYLPLRSAYAITVHKTQGRTIKNIVVDLSNDISPSDSPNFESAIVG